MHLSSIVQSFAAPSSAPGKADTANHTTSIAKAKILNLNSCEMTTNEAQHIIRVKDLFF
jgi:hypothetical protein